MNRFRAAAPILGVASLCGFVLAGLSSSAESVPNDVPGCDIGEWSRPRRVAALPAGMVTERLSLVSAGFEAAIAGYLRPLPATVRHSPWKRDLQALPIFLLDGSPVQSPGGEFWFMNPRSANGESGLLHLLWGEPADTASEMQSVPVRRILHSTYAHDRGWSAPVQVYEAEGGFPLRWATSSAIVFDRQGRLHSLVPAPGRGLAHLVYDGTNWKVQTLDQVTATDVDMAVGASGAIRAVLSGYLTLRDAANPEPPFAPTRGGGVPQSRISDHIYSLTLVEGEEEWSEPMSLGADGGIASQPSILIDPQDQTHVLWAQDVDGDVWPDVIRHVVMDGQTVRDEIEDIHLPARTIFNWWDVGMDRCGDVHLVVATSVTDGVGVTIAHRQWSRQWNSSHILQNDPIPLTNISLSQSVDGSAMALLAARYQRASSRAEWSFEVVISELPVNKH